MKRTLIATAVAAVCWEIGYERRMSRLLDAQSRRDDLWASLKSVQQPSLV